MSQKILFLHGFFASGTCIPAIALKEYFKDKAIVLAPDLPLQPKESLDFVQKLYEQEKPDMLVGNSNGSFIAQIIAAKNNIPTLLGNPHFEMTNFLIERIGPHEYKSPRADGSQQFVIDHTNLLNSNRFSGIIVNLQIKRLYGVYLERMIIWFIMNLYS